MLVEKCKRARTRHIILSWFFTILFAGLFVSFILLGLGTADEANLFWLALPPTGGAFFASLTISAIYSVCIKFKKYKFQNEKIIVYAGPYNLFLFYKDELVDEYRSFSRFIPVELKHRGEIDISCVVSRTNGIRVKINEVLVRPIN